MLLPTILLLLQQPTSPTPRPTPTREPARRREVTAAMQSDAFADSATRNLFLFARRARVAQDSALRGYDAKTQARISVSMGTSQLLRNKLLFRTENVSNVKWRRSQGMWIEPLASRTTVPMSKNVNVSGIAASLVPVPYFPGREQLWIPSTDAATVRRDVDETEGFIHPLAQGSEAYYKYQIGDSIRIRLPSGDGLTLRELKVIARRPEWRSFVGSFWFDERSGSLVRAAYRLSAPLEIWNEALEDAKREIADAERDTSAGREARVKEAREDQPPGWVRGIMNPMRFDMNLITVEYALYENKFWLPRVNRAEGSAQITFMRVPVRVEESYKYDDVDVTTALPPMPALVSARRTHASMQVCAPACEDVISDDDTDGRSPRARRKQITDSLLRANGYQPALLVDTAAASLRTRAVGDSLYKLYRDSAGKAVSLERIAVRDSLLRAAGKVVPIQTDSSREAQRTRRYGDSVYRAVTRAERRRVRDAECAASGGYYTRTETRYEGALQYAVKLPCDSTVLASSKELPASPYDANEEAFLQRDADALASSLGLGLQPAFGPQPIALDYSLNQQRYNRVEGFSFGAEAKWPLGAGYTASAAARLGIADWQPNGELRLARSNGRTTIQAAAFRRLSYTNDFGDPLSLGASMSSLLYGRDEGFYYRNIGAELTWVKQTANGQLKWRAFGEHHDPARKRWNFNIANAFSSDRRMLDNITAQKGTIGGGSVEWHAGYGLDPRGWQVTTDVRAEGAGGSFNYGRGLVDLTIAHPLFWKLSFGQTVSTGTATDSVPVQRQFYMGGLRTIRGQVAGTQVGNTYWMSRSELAYGSAALKRSLFYDVGWAGRRDNYTKPGRPQSSVGLGSSFVDGLFRVDLSQGIYPRKGRRLDLSLGARF
jgi:Omp85 superfamily domain